MPIAVAFALEPTELGAIDYGAERVVGPRAFELFVERESGDAQLELEFDDEVGSPEEARARAEELWAEIRATASLPAAAPVVLGAFRFSVAGEIRLGELIDDAEDLFEQNRHEASVVAAQVACEVAVREMLERRYEVEPEIMQVSPRALRNWALRDHAGQLLFFAATGKRVNQQADFAAWPEYNAHVERRNTVVHKGAVVSREDAQASKEAMWALIEFVRASELATALRNPRRE